MERRDAESSEMPTHQNAHRSHQRAVVFVSSRRTIFIAGFEEQRLQSATESKSALENSANCEKDLVAAAKLAAVHDFYA